MLTQVKPIPIGDAVWPAPNYINPKSRVGELLGVHIGMTVAALVIVFIRVMVRIKLVKAAGMDDYLIITASVLALVSTTVMCLETSGGAGLHIWDVKIDNNFAKTLQYSFASQILYMPIVQTVKMSVLMFYLRLSPDRKFRILVFTVMSMCSILAVSWVLVVLFGCNPIPKSWSFWMVGTCYDHTSFYRATGIINIILDFVLFLLPYQVLKKLQIAHKQKIALWVLLSVGILVLITSVIRITLYFGGKWTLSYTDPTYWEVDTQNWSCIEYCTGIICASLPPLKPLFTQLLPSIFGRGAAARGLYFGKGTRSRGSSRSGNNRQKNVYSLSFVPGGAGATTLNGHHAEIVHKVGGRHTKPVHGPALPTKIMEENVSIWGEGVITVTKDVQVERETDELWSDEESLGGILVTKNFRVEETNADDDDDDRSERRRSR